MPASLVVKLDCKKGLGRFNFKIKAYKLFGYTSILVLCLFLQLF